MNKKRRLAILGSYEELKSLVEEERETIDNQEESFGHTDKWEESERICSDAENVLDDLESTLQEWEIL